MEELIIYNFKDALDIILSITTIGAILIGGWWSYIKFFKEAEHESSVTVSLECQVLKDNNQKKRILSINAIFHNNGKVPAQIIPEFSSIEIYKINPKNQEESKEQYSNCYRFKLKGAFNIPVNGTMNIVDYTFIDHPAIYMVETFFVQSRQESKKFYKRMKSIYKQDGNALSYNKNYLEEIFAEDQINTFLDEGRITKLPSEGNEEMYKIIDRKFYIDYPYFDPSGWGEDTIISSDINCS